MHWFWRADMKLAQVSVPFFWDGYEPVIFMCLLGIGPIIGFLFGVMRAGKRRGPAEWRTRQRQEYRRQKRCWLTGYYAVLLFGLLLLIITASGVALAMVLAVGPLFAFWFYLAATEFTFRVPESECRKCRYNLTGNVSGVCPECGTPIADRSGKP